MNKALHLHETAEKQKSQRFFFKVATFNKMDTFTHNEVGKMSRM